MSVGGRLRASLNVKTRLSTTLKSWLPILQSGAMELEETLTSIAYENPYASVQSQVTQSLHARIAQVPKSSSRKGTQTDRIETSNIKEQSLYEVLEDQIDSKLFPTAISKSIASKIIASQ